MDIKNKKLLMTVSTVLSAFVIIFSLITVIVAVVISNSKDDDEIIEPLPPKEKAELCEMNGVWIASVSNIDFPSSPNLSKSELMAELDSIAKTVHSIGLDTVFFQVRPASDALYESDIFPVSKYLSEDRTLTLDALEYLIKACDEYGIAVHAWINPLRVASGGEVSDLPDGHPAKENPEWCVKYADKQIYYNCAIPEVRQLVAKGITEIVENYDVKGIVFDDYFYPYPVYIADNMGNSTVVDFDDSDEYSLYGTGFDDIGDWRRENVNLLVKASYEAVKKSDPDCVFGVSPFGIWKNGYGDESGSATRGAQSYFDVYCDTLAWAKGGYVDYVMPQLYWRSEESAASYNALYDWWALVLGKADVPLLVSHAAYRYSEWESPEGVMTSQIQYARTTDIYRGSMFYGYSEIKDNIFGICDELTEIYKE